MTDARQEQALSELLHEIARADERVAVPQRIEQRVIERWERDAQARAASRPISRPDGKSSSPHQRSGTYRRRIAIGALAAAVILAIGLNHRSSARVAVQTSVPAQHAGQQVQGAVVPPPAPVAAAVTRPAPPVRTSRSARRPPVDAERDVVRFVPLSSTAQQDLSGSFQIARVRLPRELLADLGVMLDANRVGEPIEADVVFGEDGLARAIRLAPASWRSQ